MTLALLSKQPAGHSYLRDSHGKAMSASLHTECKHCFYILCAGAEAHRDAYLLQVVPLHWSRNLTSQETI